MATTGLDLDRYLGNWLLITGVMFAVSGLLLALKLRSRSADRPMIAGGGSAAARPGDGPRTRRHRRRGPWSGRRRGRCWSGPLFAAWVVALAIYGVIESFPI